MGRQEKEGFYYERVQFYLSMNWDNRTVQSTSLFGKGQVAQRHNLCWATEPGWNQGVIPGLILQAELCTRTLLLLWHSSRITC